MSGHDSLRNGNTKSTFELVTEGLPPQKQQLLSYFIYEQHYIELMESGKSLDAIALLQKQLVPRSPFGKDKTNLFKLASMIMKPLQMCKGDPSKKYEAPIR